MLAQMRGLSRSIFAKVLLGLLILAFAIWGIQGAFSGMMNTNIAEVGGRKISQDEAKRAFERQYDEIRGRAEKEGRPTPSQADLIRAGLHEQVIEMLIQQEAIFAYANRLGLRTDDADAARDIRQVLGLSDESSELEAMANYRRLLEQANFASRTQFEDYVRDYISSQQLASAVVAGVRTPRSFALLEFSAVTEERTLEVADFQASAFGPLPAPTDAQLQSVYESLSDRAPIAVPAYRRVTLVTAHPERFAAQQEVSEAELRAFYDRQRPAETRSFTIIHTRSEADARAAAQRLARGEAPAAIAASFDVQTQSFTDRPIGNRSEDILWRNIFALPRDAGPQAVRSERGFAAVRLDAPPKEPPSFEAMREELRAQLALEQAIPAIADAMTAFDRDIREGASYEDAARTAGFEHSVVEIDERGLTRTGAPLFTTFNARDRNLLLSNINQADAGSDNLFEAEGESIAFRVDEIIEPSKRPLAEVREFVVRAWEERTRQDRLDDAAERVEQRLGRGESFAAAVRAERGTVRAQRFALRHEPTARAIETANEPVDAWRGYVVEQLSVIPSAYRPNVTELVSRDEFWAQIQSPYSALPAILERAGGAGQSISRFRDSAFGAARQGTAQYVSPDANAMVLARVVEITRADPSENGARVDSIRDAMQSGLQRGLIEAVANRAVETGNPQRNDRLVEATFPDPDSAQQQQ